MFFIMGMSQGREDLDFDQRAHCAICGRFGNYRVFMTYTYLSLFFIPLFKWNRRYFVEMSCCGSLYELDPEVGRAIASGRDVSISERDMVLIRRGPSGYRDAYEQEEREKPRRLISSGDFAGKQDRRDRRPDPVDFGDGGNSGIGGSPENEGSLRSGGNRGDGGSAGAVRRFCPECGFSTTEDFDYCPRCGSKLT